MALPTATEIATFRQSLQSWIDEESIDADQRGKRVEAAEIIVEAYRTQSIQLNLYQKNLTSIPPEISNLTQLRRINLSYNQLTTIPPEISNLTRLSHINLFYNQLTTIPPEISNLTQLGYIDLSYNQLTTIPDSIFLLSNLYYLNITQNRITAAECRRLSALPRSATLDSFFFHDPITIAGAGSGFGSSAATPETSSTIRPDILEAILAYESNDAKKEGIKRFLLETPDEQLGGFRLLLNQCSRTKSWKDGGDTKAGICEVLYRISDAASKDEIVASKVNAQSLGSAESCGDRVARTLIDVQLTALYFKKSPQEIAAGPISADAATELLEFARVSSIIKFLQEKANAKFIANQRGDEIETHLAYMQLAPELGCNLSGLEMLFRGCSGVSDSDLTETKSIYQGPSEIAGMSMAEYLKLSYMIDDDIFSEIKFIKDIKNTIVQKDEFDTNQIEITEADGSRRSETDAEYQERLQGLEKKLRTATIEDLRDKLASLIKTELGQKEMKTAANPSALIPPTPSSTITASENIETPNKAVRTSRNLVARLCGFISSLLPGRR